MTHLPPDRRVAPRSSAALAAALSFLFPGLGQAYAGRPRLGLVFAAPVLILIGLVGGALAHGTDTLLRTLLLPGVLLAVFGVNLGLMLWRLIAVCHAGLSTPIRPAGPDAFAGAARGRSPATLAVVGLLMVITVGMHVWVAAAAVSAEQALARIFTPPDRAPPAFEQVDPFVPEYRWEGTERVNFLLIGSDAGPGRTDELTDTIMVVSLDPATRTAALVSIPRDTGYVPLPDRSVYGDGIFPRRINELASDANANPATWCPSLAAGENCGLHVLGQTVGLYLGLEIHHVAWVDLLGFAALVDAIGGVDLCLPGVLSDPQYGGPTWEGRPRGVVLDAGCHHYDGAHALAYARIRMGTLTLPDGTVETQDDFLRAARQQDFLLAVQRKVADTNLFLSLPTLLTAMSETVTTDFPRARAGDLATLAPLIASEDIDRVVLGWPGYVDLPVDPLIYYLLIPNRDAVRTEMARMLGGEVELAGWYLGSTAAGPPS